MGEEEGFLKRWSRRKQEAQSGLATGAAGDEAPAQQAADEPAEPAEDIEAANRAAAEAIDLESLTYESDFSAFLKKGVPAALKNAALRKLWASSPVLANIDGLNDYDEDFRLGNQLGREFKTAWEVGRGYARKFEELQEKAVKAPVAEEAAVAAPVDAALPPDDEAPPPGPAAQKDLGASGDRDAAASGTATADDSQAGPDEVREEEQPSKISLRRRMTFGEG